MTLVEAAKLTTDQLLAGVLELLVKDDPILARIPFQEAVGNGWTYNREATMPTAQWHDDGDEWHEDAPTFSQETALIKILGGDVDVSEFQKATRSNINDVRQENLEAKIKALQWEFNDSFFYGSATTNPKQFTGVHGLISSTTYNTVHAGATTGTALSIAKLDELLDLLKGKPDILVSTKKVRRLVTTYLRSVTTIQTDRDVFGQQVMMYGTGIPWLTSEFLVDTETASSGAYAAKTGGSCATIFALKFGVKAVTGLQVGGLKVEPIGQLETKDAERIRVKWYCGMALPSLIVCGKLDGILTSGAVTA
jgi:hypothetical protein